MSDKTPRAQDDTKAPPQENAGSKGPGTTTQATEGGSESEKDAGRSFVKK